MIIEIVFQEKQCGGNNVISFSDYAGRLGARSKRAARFYSWEENLRMLAGGNVVNLNDRRH